MTLLILALTSISDTINSFLESYHQSSSKELPRYATQARGNDDRLHRPTMLRHKSGESTYVPPTAHASARDLLCNNGYIGNNTPTGYASSHTFSIPYPRWLPAVSQRGTLRLLPFRRKPIMHHWPCHSRGKQWWNNPAQGRIWPTQISGATSSSLISGHHFIFRVSLHHHLSMGAISSFIWPNKVATIHFPSKQAERTLSVWRCQNLCQFKP